MKYKKSVKIFLIMTILLTLSVQTVFASTARIKDIARIGGVRKNQLVGYGIIVGLNGTGDKNIMTASSITNVLKHFGVTTDSRQLKAQNAASVIVTATIDPFLRSGDNIDIVVSSIGDAKSIQGGVLLQTPLKGADNRVYAVAQGAISIGGIDLTTGGGGKGGNHPTVARVPDGAIVENEIPFSFSKNGYINIVLNQKDFTTANTLSKTIEDKFGSDFAFPVDAGLVKVKIPRVFQKNPVRFIALIESMKVETDYATKIIINEKTGTIVIGSEVRISPVVVAHGDIRLRITDDNGQSIKSNKSFINMKAGINIQELVDTLNSVGITTKDVIAILQAIKASGALQAKMEVI